MLSSPGRVRHPDARRLRPTHRPDPHAEFWRRPNGLYTMASANRADTCNGASPDMRPTPEFLVFSKKPRAFLPIVGAIAGAAASLSAADHARGTLPRERMAEARRQGENPREAA